MLQIFAIFDAAAEVYMRPFYAQSRGEAIRAFSDLVDDQEHPIGKHPEDYSLFVVGSFDPQTGAVSSLTERVCLGQAIEFRARGRVASLEVAG